MKKMWNMWLRDLQDEGFGKKEIVLYGIVWPLGLLFVLGLIEGLSR